jgi:hypothetical protein
MQIVYLLKRNKIISGPFSIENLKRRGVKSTDMVWCEGLDDWMPVFEVDFLSDVPVISSDDNAKSLIQRVFSFLE